VKVVSLTAEELDAIGDLMPAVQLANIAHRGSALESAVYKLRPDKLSPQQVRKINERYKRGWEEWAALCADA
jgi:hypothetical protein